MVSTEIVDSGRPSGGRSNFSQMCSLFSRYLKEKGSFGELNLDFPSHSHSLDNNKGSQLIKKSGCEDVKEQKPSLSDLETPKMTIFYAGRVMVFDDLPADKAREILMIAGKSGPTRPKPAFAHHVMLTFGLPSNPPVHPPLHSDLPIARKNSLARFLEKRKHRITANAPYTANKLEAQPKLATTSEPRLGVAPELTSHSIIPP
ncbi:jasmonate Zim-domain protein [Striga asiatica]|uniref:Protein TIFY n=1 Tax=Striga asiatica TaxID=4170 RepID=A0A5A7Q6S3_STRAF|nr:jasmonate Zim-domain protein [Striga asiatica]